MSHSCPSLLSPEAMIKHPYAYDYPQSCRKAPAYTCTNLCHSNKDIFARRDPYAHMESFIPTISEESLPWLQLGEEKFAEVVRQSRRRSVAMGLARRNFRTHLQRAVQIVRDRLIYVKLPSQVKARFPRRCSACEREPVYYL